MKCYKNLGKMRNSIYPFGLIARKSLETIKKCIFLYSTEWKLDCNRSSREWKETE